MLEPQAQGPIGSSPDTIKKTHKFRHGCTVLGGGGGIKAGGSLLGREKDGDNLPVRCRSQCSVLALHT